jgi:iron complex outermembrane receptor protein
MNPCFDFTISAWRIPAALFAVGATLFLVQPLGAQGNATGGIEGRVSHPGNASYLENARVVIEGTRFETFTDATGAYRFVDVPAGPVKLRTFFTGFEEQTTTVTVAIGQTVQHDIKLGSIDAGAERARGPIRLSRYVVAEKQQMEGAAIAINEQRFAPNLKTVVAADEFGARRRRRGRAAEIPAGRLDGVSRG